MAQYQSFPSAVGDSSTLDKLKALRLPDLAGKAFLDVGCNEGFFCGFARFQGANRVVGIDRSKEFISRARSRFPECEFHQADWSTLPGGQFDLILLASALHYAEDQPALIDSLVERLSPEGTLVLELGIASSRKAEWRKVKRGIDERLFPSMPMLREVLAAHAWKWMGPSVRQAGDPVPRHVIHVSRRRPVAYLLMQPPGYGKTSLASGLFRTADVAVISGDTQVSVLAAGKGAASDELRAAINEDYSPFRIDQAIQRVFERGLGEELVELWLGEARGLDMALDMYVPGPYHGLVESLLAARGYMPVRLDWGRIGAPPLPEDIAAQQAEAFYLSMLGSDDSGSGPASASFQPGGFVDEVRIVEGALVIRGWAIDSKGGLPPRLVVRMGRRAMQVLRMDRQLRPDVQRHLGLPHALVGYQISVDSPAAQRIDDLLPALKVSVPGGAAFPLAGSPGQVFRENAGECANREDR